MSAADVGHTLTVEATAHDGEGPDGLVGANAAGPILAPPPPANAAKPLISGTVQVGQILDATRGRWSSPDRLTYTVKWQRCDSTGAGCSDISGTGGHYHYTLASADLGHNVRSVITAADQEGQRKTAAAAAAGPVT